MKILNFDFSFKILTSCDFFRYSASFSRFWKSARSFARSPQPGKPALRNRISTNWISYRNRAITSLKRYCNNYTTWTKILQVDMYYSCCSSWTTTTGSRKGMDLNMLLIINKKGFVRFLENKINFKMHYHFYLPNNLG